MKLQENINRIKQIMGVIIENVDNKNFLGYHSSRNDMSNGYYKGDILDSSDYSDVIRNAYMDIISDYDENLEDENIDGMNEVFESEGFGFTFVSDEPLMSSSFQSSKYKYGDYLYKVYGDGSEILLDDVNEIGATIVVSRKPLYFENIS
jgi:hypothetical protein